MPLPSLKPLVAALLLSPLLGTAQAATTVNLSYNGAPDPDKNAVHVFSTNFQTLVKEKTDGEIRLKLYPNSMPDEEQECMKKLGYKCLIEVMWELMDKHQNPHQLSSEGVSLSVCLCLSISHAMMLNFS